ncbi:MAG: ISL3 family transposase [Sphaerochaetaceae bacterium]|jgi:transposase
MATAITGYDVFEQALGIIKPWSVTGTELRKSEDGKRLEMHITVDFAAGSEFPCPQCGTDCKVYDTSERIWRHLNFFQYRCYIHARVPRISCERHGTRTVQVPWGREGSGFTLMMEGVILALLQHMPVKAAAREIGEHDTRLWRVLNHYVSDALKERSFSDVKDIGIDEYSHSGHDYITVILSHPTEKHSKARVLDIEDGKGNDTVALFGAKFSELGGKAEEVENVTSDMIHGFRNAMKAQFPNSTVTVDRFHVMKLIGDSVDTIRRGEAGGRDRAKSSILSRTRYLWLKNRENLKPEQRERLDALLELKNLDTAIAYDFRLRLQSIYENSEDRETACWHYENLVADMHNSGIKELARAAKSLIGNAVEILNYFDSKRTNAILEGFNSKISIIKNRARGFRNRENFKNMIYFCMGDLSMPIAHIMA